MDVDSALPRRRFAVVYVDDPDDSGHFADFVHHNHPDPSLPSSPAPHLSPLFSADVPPTGPVELPLSLLEMGSSGRFELITWPLRGPPLAPLSTVSMVQESLLMRGLLSFFGSRSSQSQSLLKWKHNMCFRNYE